MKYPCRMRDSNIHKGGGQNIETKKEEKILNYSVNA